MAEGPNVRLSFPEPDIAVLTFDAVGKSANVFSRHVLDEIDAHLTELEKRSNLAGLILESAKPGVFVFGADVTEFVAAGQASRADKVAMSTRGRKLFQRLSRAPFVTVAAIDGGAFGGGLEISVWCDRRIMTSNPKAQVGFPEVKLGIYPGWGGCARSPRIIGLANAIELVAAGDPIDSLTAYKMGLADDVVASDQLRAAAIGLIRAEKSSRAHLADRKRWDAPIDITDTELGFLGATASAYIQQQTKGQYPAPLAALDVMLGTAKEDIETACQAEAEGFANLFGSPINQALVNVFFLSDRNKKETGVAADVKPAEIKSVGVFGAGIMGAGIGAAAVKREMSVTITDVAAPALAAGVKTMLEEVSFDKTSKGPDPQKMLRFAPLVNATSSDVEFAGCDLVIEAVIENPQIKQELYARIEPVLRGDAILASNTSAISIGLLAAGLKRPEQFVGIHFFNPVRKMPLVEVIRGPKTSDQTVATAVAWCKKIGKSPIVVEDGPGFLVNRLLLPYMNEALEVVLDGVDIKQVDRAAKGFGMPMGPITLYDVVGLDTAHHAGHVMAEAFPDRVIESALLTAMYRAGRYGQKSGKGFFDYTKAKKGKGAPDPAVADIIGPLVRGQARLSDQQIVERLFLPMVLEASRILAEKKVADARDVDLGLIFGTGFPPFKGGLLFWADSIGAAKIVEMLKPYESLGARYQPTPLLLELAKSGRKFYDPR